MITTFFWCKFGFGKCSGASSWFYHWVSHHWLSHKIHFSLHITIWLRNGSLLHRIREDDSSKQWFFKILISSWSTHLLSFFHLSNLLQMLKIVEWLMLSSLATSHVVVRESASVTALNWSLLTSDGWPLGSSSSRHFFAKLLEPPLPCMFISSSWAKWIVDVESCLPCFTTHFELKKEFS